MAYSLRYVQNVVFSFKSIREIGFYHSLRTNTFMRNSEIYIYIYKPKQCNLEMTTGNILMCVCGKYISNKIGMG